MRIILVSLVASAILLACSDKKSTSSETEVSTENTTANTADSTQFLGESFEIEQVMFVNELPSKIGKQDSMIVIAKGKVMEVCQAKGCWMTLEMPNNESMRVTFKDYGFFMPKDLAGKEVIMKGKASYTTTDVASLKHLAQDAGKSEAEVAQITEPELALNFEATGVAIL